MTLSDMASILPPPLINIPLSIPTHTPDTHTRNREFRFLDDIFLAIPITMIRIVIIIQRLERVHSNHPRPRRRLPAGHRFGARRTGRTVGVCRDPDAEGEEGPESGQRAGDETDAFFGQGPKADFAGGVHEFTGVAVEGEVLQADDGCA